MPLAQEHGAAVVALTIDEEGQARTAEWKVAIAARLIDDLAGPLGDAGHDVHRRLPDLPDRHRAGGDPPRRARDDRGDPRAQAAAPRRADDARRLQRLVRAQPGRAARAQLGVPARVHEGRPRLRDRARGQDPAAVADPRRAAGGRARPRVRPPHATGYDPLQRLLELFAGVTAADAKADRAAELAALPLGERLQRRIIDGERNGLEADLDEALGRGKPALDIVNDDLLAGMKVVGELFGSGEMQLPFVLQSAEVMKTAVAHLEPHMEKTDDEGKGTIVLATVKGDVHDIGKNLVDIILTNNGYTVVNLGIKQPVSAILDAAEEHDADVIGMSGLLVKSTVIMKENLEELNQRGLSTRWPVMLGGAALTRAYVEQDLAELFDGEVRYARDAFEGLRLMDALMAVKRGVPGAELPELRERRVTAGRGRRDRAPGRRTRPLRRRVRPTRCRRRRSGATGSSRASRWPTSRRTSTSGRRSWASGG